MGLLKWFSRLGAVGGTARWAANGYKFYRQRHPDKTEWPDIAIFRLMIVSRFEVLSDSKSQEYLLSISDSIRGLRGLVVAILSVEASFNENTTSYQHMLLDVIEEELEKKGIAREVVLGYG